MKTNKKMNLVVGLVGVLASLPIGAAVAKSNSQATGNSTTPSGWKPRMKMSEAAPDKELGLPEDSLIGRKVFNLLKYRKFDELQSLLLGLQSEMEKDISKEDPLVDAFEGFGIPDPAARTLFTEWVKKYPDQWPALAARGGYFAGLGFEARGQKWVTETNREQIDGMKWFFELARPDLEKAVALNPRCVPALRRLIAVESALGDAPGAVTKYVGKCPESYRLRAQGLQFLRPRWGGSNEAMLAFIEESLRYADTNPRMRQLDGFSLIDKADLLHRGQKHEEALRLVRAAIVMSDNWQYPLLEGRILLAMKNHAQALASFDVAVKRRMNGESLAWRAMALLELERYDEALEALQKAMQIEPFNDTAQSVMAKGAKELIRKGHAAMQAGDLQRAEDCLLKAPGFAPRAVNARVYLAHTYIKKKQFPEAERAVRHAVALAPREYDNVLLLDWILAQRRDWNGIVAAWTDFLRLEPRHGKAYMERAGARRRNLEQAEAIADLKKACELGIAEACALVR